MSRIGKGTRPYTIQEWINGCWKSGRARYTSLQTAFEVAQYGKPKRVLEKGSLVVYRNNAALKLEQK